MRFFLPSVEALAALAGAVLEGVLAMMEMRERSFKLSSKISNVNKVIPSGNLRVPTCLKHMFLSEPTVSDTTHHHLGITTA